MDLQRFEEQHHLPPFSDFKALKKEGTRIITHAQGHMIYDSDGHAILDAMHKLPYYNSFFKTSNEPVARLSAKLASIAPEHLNHVIYANSGSEANDTIIRLVRHYWALKGHPEKRVIIGRECGYHGSTIMAASMGGMKAMHEQSAHEADFEHIRPPYGFLYQGNQTESQFAESSAKLLKEKILEVGADKVAAFIAEPVQGAGGVIIPPDGYFEHIQKICNEFGILFIADEVITGFGRTGNWFASQTMDLKPDVVTLAKGLTSGYMPMSAVLVSDTIAEYLINEGGEFYHGFTYSGHPVSAAVALANLELIETEGLIEHVRDITAPYLGDAIKHLDSHPLVGETRSFGLLACIELVQHKSGPVLFDPIGEVGTLCRDHAIKGGLMVRAVRDGMILSPPLSFQTKDIDITIEKLKQALDATYAELKK